MAQSRHFFAGSNTRAGFRGFFDQLRDRAGWCTLIKGGPGVGKSTLMGEVGKHFEALGHQDSYYHCSGDPESLDAVYSREADYMVMDGTAPHVVDPKLPGAGDGILNLGVCLNEKQLAAQRQQLEEIAQEMTRCYGRAHRYLRGAHAMREDAAAVYEAALSPKARRSLENELLSLLPGGPEGEESHLFAQAITCHGMLQKMDDALTGTVYCLDVPWGMNVHGLLAPVLEGARRGRLQRCVYHDPLDGEDVAHVAAGSAVFTTAVITDAPAFAPEMDSHLLHREAPRLAFDRAVYDLTFNQAVEALAEAKALHDRLERYYMDAMDYGRLNAIRQEFMEGLPH